MPTVTSFVFPGYFPFCPTTATRAEAYVDNVSLTTAMEIYWNAYNFDLTLSGTATSGTYTVDIGGVYSANPAGFTGSAYNSQNALDSAWSGSGYSTTVFGSVPAFRTPVQRVCVPVPNSNTDRLLFVNLSGATYQFEDGVIEFYLRADPNNADKFRIYYYLDFIVEEDHDPDHAGVSLGSFSSRTGYTTVVTSTIDFFSLSLTYYGHYVGSSYSNISMSCTGQLYTY